MKRDTRSAYRARAAAAERSIDAGLEESAAARKAESERRIASYDAKYAPVPFTQAELKAARVIRVGHSWYKVVRVNAKTVTVPSGYSWNDHIAIEKIDEVRA